jgi:hypothetical protein
VTQVSLTIELPPIAPLPFSLTHNKEAMHLAFSETSLSIDYRTDGFDIAASRTVSLWLLNNRWINGAGDPIDIVNSLTVSFENNNLTKIQSSGSLTGSGPGVRHRRRHPFQGAKRSGAHLRRHPGP